MEQLIKTDYGRGWGDGHKSGYEEGYARGLFDAATSPWIDGPPPKDERQYLSYYGPGDVGMTSWCTTVRRWNIEDRFTDKDPIKHALIKKP